MDAVSENLVMTFDEFVRRFGDGGEGGETACKPFVYVGAGDSGYEEGRIVSGSCIHCGHRGIISVWGQNSVYGYPRLLVSEEDCPKGTVWMSLEYVPIEGEPVDIAPQLYLETETGAISWCR